MRISDWSSDVCSSDLLLTGPGWIFMGGFKILIGSCLAVIALGYAFSETDVANPTMLYYLVFSGLSHTPAVAVVLTGLFVAICQRSEEHTSELQSLMRILYAVFCLKKKNKLNTSH